MPVMGRRRSKSKWQIIEDEEGIIRISLGVVLKLKHPALQYFLSMTPTVLISLARNVSFFKWPKGFKERNKKFYIASSVGRISSRKTKNDLETEDKKSMRNRVISMRNRVIK